MLVSIFNDVIGPVMRGPSSSHCAAALSIGRLARDLMEARLDEVLVEFDRQGSLPAPHETQGSNMGLFGGLLGWDAADERLPVPFRHCETQARAFASRRLTWLTPIQIPTVSRCAAEANSISCVPSPPAAA